MLQLEYANQEDQAAAVRDKLSSLSLAFKEKQSDVAEITLIDGDNTIVGITNINEHLAQLEGELHQWYYCDC